MAELKLSDMLGTSRAGESVDSAESINTEKKTDSRLPQRSTAELELRLQELEQERDAARELYRSAVEAMPGGIVQVSRDGEVIYANAEACRILGLSYDELTSRYTTDFRTETIDENGRPFAVEDYPVSRALATGKAQGPVTLGVRRPDGSTSWAVYRAIPWPGSGEADGGAIVTFVDITAERETMKALREGELNLRAMLENWPHYIGCLERDGRIIYLNRTDPVITKQEIIGRTIYDFNPEDRHEMLRNTLRRVFDEGVTVSYESDVVLNGKKVYTQNTVWPVYRDDQVAYANISSVDITELRSLQERLLFQANHDMLTALMNRAAFKERVQDAVERAREGDVRCVLVYLDLDQFKIVNDSCGHTAGDELLCRFAYMLRDHIAERGVVARLGGDEFGILLENTDSDQALQILDAFQNRLRAFRFPWEERVFQIGMSAGLVEIHSGTEGFARLLRDADLACFAAKDSGRDRIQIYRPDDERMHLREQYLGRVATVNRAIADGNLLLYCQEIRRANRDGENLRCGEILSRLHAEDGHGTIPAAQFIPAVESFEMMFRLDQEVIRQVLTVLEGDERVAGLDFLALNLSGASVSDLRFQDFVRDIVGRHPDAARKLCFEITETAAVSNLEAVRVFMSDLCRMGCRFALDDFGAGLSSFAYLRNLPVDLLKIDGTLVRGLLENDAVDRVMVTSIRDLCRAIGKETVAEHVEAAEEVALLQEVGVDFVQGYGIHRPEPLEDFLNRD